MSIAPRDITVCPFTASPTSLITPVFVPPVIIHAPVVLAACVKHFEKRFNVNSLRGYYGCSLSTLIFLYFGYMCSKSRTFSPFYGVL